MKNFALLVAIALVAFAVPASAGEISQAVLASTPEQQSERPVPPFEPVKPPPIEYCSAVQGTSCTTLGDRKSCTDVCSSQLSCTCGYDYGNPGVWYWNCDWEC